MRLLSILLILMGCSRDFSTGPMIIFESPIHMSTVGNHAEECREIELSGKIYNVEKLADYSYFVQGHSIPKVLIRPTSADNVWEWSMTIDLLSTSYDSGESSTLTRDMVTNELGWSKRVRPFVAEIVEVGDESDTSSFVYRDVITTFDRRGPNCQPWDFSWETTDVEDSWSTYISADGIVELNTAVLLNFPYPEIQSPEDFVEETIDMGLAGPVEGNHCVNWSDIEEPTIEWQAIVTTLKTSAASINSTSSSPIYPVASLDSSWAICADWSTEFSTLGWERHSSFLVDTTHDPLLYQWSYPNVPFSLLASSSNATIGYWRSGAIDSTMSASTSIDDCLIDGMVTFDAEQTMDLSGNASGGLDIDSGGSVIDAESFLDEGHDHCGGDWIELSDQLASDASLQLRAVWEDALNIGSPSNHLLLSVQHVFEQTIFGLIGDASEAALSTIVNVGYEPGEIGECLEDGPGLYFSYTSGAISLDEPSAGAYWARWGSTLFLDNGTVFDESNCDEYYEYGELVLESPIHTLSTVMNTSPLNNLHNALSGNLRIQLEGGYDAEATVFAQSLGWPTIRQQDLLIDIVPTLPPFLSPEWHPQIGHWEITVTDTQNSSEPLMIAYASAISAFGFDEINFFPLTIDDQLQSADIESSNIIINILPQSGTERFSNSLIQTNLAPILRESFAEHIHTVVAHMGFPEWAENIGGAPFSRVEQLTIQWSDNHVVYPITVSE